MLLLFVYILPESTLFKQPHLQRTRSYWSCSPAVVNSYPTGVQYKQSHTKVYRAATVTGSITHLICLSVKFERRYRRFGIMTLHLCFLCILLHTAYILVLVCSFTPYMNLSQFVCQLWWKIT